MSVMDAIEKAKIKAVPKSAAMETWESLEENERKEIKLVLTSGAAGADKLSVLLRAEGVKLNHHFLGKVKRGEVDA